MSETSKKARADMKAKAKRMAAGEPGAKVDASSWAPPEGLNADKQTGLRPVSQRQFKRGGKLKGKAAAVRADRKPRKSGGATMTRRHRADGGEVDDMEREITRRGIEREIRDRIGAPPSLPRGPDMAHKRGGRTRKSGGAAMVSDKINRNVKDANAEKFGKPHIGGMKRGGGMKRKEGGRVGKAFGGPMMGGGAGMAPHPQMAAPGGMGAPGGVGGPPQLPPQVQALLANRAAQGMGPPPMQGPPPGMQGPAMGAMPQGPAVMGGGQPQIPPAVMARLAQMRGQGGFGGAPVGPMGGGAPVSPPVSPPPTMPPPPPPPFKAGGSVNSQNGSNYLGGTRPTGGRIARASGGKAGGKGKTNIIIAVNPGGSMGGDPTQQAQGPRQQMPVPVSAPPQGVPMQMPPAGPPPGPPPGAPPPAQMMPRKSGGRALANSLPKKTASSYKDMTAGSLSGIGRLQKTSIAEKQGRKLGAPT